MAYNEDNAFAVNIRGVTDLVESGINKTGDSSVLQNEGSSGDKQDVLDLPMDDKDLLFLRDEWENKYSSYEGKIKPTFERNLKSYLGRNKENTVPAEDQITAANLQFESEETFLPAALAQNPDPIVFADNSPEGNSLSQSVKTMLQFHAQQLLLRMKLKFMVRQWSIYQLSVLKLGWDNETNDIATDNRQIDKFIFDPEGYVDVYGRFCSWLGERIELTAEELIQLFPKKEREIKLEVGDKLGTKIIYTEWWTDEYCFSTMKNVVLEKHKNQYFIRQEELSEEELQSYTQPYNHFAKPQKPYVFLSVFSLQQRPHDITGLIEQNIPNQTKISRRVEQIDSNVSQSNNGIAFSENNFNQETAKQATNAITTGVGKILVPPGGPIGEAIVRIPAPSFPDAAFNDLEMTENHLRSSWGVQGIASQPQKPDTTARGMILNQGRDTSRIGGGITDIIEQSVAASIFNWWVQLYLVFYDEPHFASVLGTNKAVDYTTLRSSQINRQLVVSVSPNSMKPKDEITRMNLAQDLFVKGAIGPKTLLETLDFPNPDESAADGILYKLDPKTYLELNFPDLMGKINQMAMQAQQAQMGGQPTPQTPTTPPVPTEPTAVPMQQVPVPPLQ